MNIIRQWKSILVSILVILVMFFLVSVFDVILAVLSMRFYSPTAFIVMFGVGGIFAALFSYSYGIGIASPKNKWTRWTVTGSIVSTGLLFFFFLAPLESGEYEPAFKAFGIMLIPSSLLLYKSKMEV